MLKRPISMLGKNKVSVILCLLIFFITWGIAGCQQQAQQPTLGTTTTQQPGQEQPTTQQPAQGETGANFVKITAPQPGDLADGFLVVSGTYSCSQDMTLYLSLYTGDGRKLAFANPGWGQASPPKDMPFKAIFNFVPPTSTDGYLKAYFISSLGKAGPVLAHVPIKFATRSTDPNVYPTACVTAVTQMLDKPNGNINGGVEKGDAVTVLKSSNGWSQILIYLFNGGPNIGWIPSNVLTTDTTGLTEGYLNTDVTPMTGPPPDGKPKTYPGNNRNIMIERGNPTYYVDKEDGWVNAAFGAGLGGWIPIKDIDFVGPSVNTYAN